MFALQQQSAKIDSFTPRAEFDGEERSPAGSIKFSLSGHSNLLDNFLPGMREVLFRKPALQGEQPPLFPGDELTQVAFPKLADLKLAEKFPGYKVQIGEGLECSKPIVLGECTLSAFSFETINGGAIGISFSVACHPDEDQAGALCQMVQQERYVTLVPPEPVAQQQLDVGPGQDALDAQEAADEAARLTAAGADA